MKKKMVAMLLVFVIAVCIFPTTAFAAPAEGPEIMPFDVKVYYINGDNVSLRSGASIMYSSGGQVNKGDKSEICYKNATSYFVDEYGCTDEYGNVYVWRYIHMTTGNCTGLTGYVVSKYVSERNQTAED